MPGVSRRRAFKPGLVQPPRPHPHFARIQQHTELDQEAVAVLQGGDHRPRVPTGIEMPAERRQRPGQIAATKRVGRLKEIPLGKIGRQILDVALLDHRPIADIGAELVQLLHKQPCVGADLRQQEPQRIRRDRRALTRHLGQGHLFQHGRARRAVVADEGVVGRRLAPFDESPPAVDRRGSDHHRHLLRIHRRQQRLQILDLSQRAFAPPRHRVSQKRHVFEPDHALSAEQRDCLHALPETVHRRLDLADIVGEPIQHFPRKFVRHVSCERVVALLAQPVDQEIVRPADKDEWFGSHRAPVCRRSARSARKKMRPVNGPGDAETNDIA